MKLANSKLELQAIRTICSRDQRVANTMLASLSEDFFFHGPARAALTSILKSVKADGSIPTFDAVCSDPMLDEKTRRLLKATESKPLRDIESVKSTVKALDNFRKLRGLYALAERIYDNIESDATDLDKLIDDTQSDLTTVRSRIDAARTLQRTGIQNNTSELVKRLLSPEEKPIIPTGFEPFDEKNGGFLRGSLVLLGADTGGGKSAVANQLALNISERGYNVTLVPLEMTAEQMMARKLGSLSGLDVNRISQGKLDSDEKQKIKEEYRKYVKRLKETGSYYALLTPEEDMSIEEILFTLKPYDDDVIIIDYASLLKDADGEDQWRKLGAIARFAKVFAKNTNKVIILLVQVTSEGMVRYSRTMVEHCLIGSTLILTNKGLRRIDSIFGKSPTHVESVPVHGLKAKTFNGFQPITNAHFNGYRTVYKVTSSRGQSITGTASHRIFVVDRDTLEIVEKRIDELRQDDIIIQYK